MGDFYSDILNSVYKDFFNQEPDPKDPNYKLMSDAIDDLVNPYDKKKVDKKGDNQSIFPELNADPDWQKKAKESVYTDINKPTEQQTEVKAEAEAEPKKEAEPETDPMEDLESLTGLTNIKADVKELISFVKTQKLRKEAGLKTVPVSLHLVFTGNPGTGKTTVARILARLYKQIGVLEQGQLVEVDRSQLVAGYVGQTAIQTQKKIQEAMGGVLFIDEAYTLSTGGQGDFGQEAIDTILKAMEDNRDNFIVIVAGYTDRMESFINSNPGLKSRFNKYFQFPDYTADELMVIFKNNCKKYEYTLSEDVEEKIKAHIADMEAAKDENFANAREVRNYFEAIITNQAQRVSGIEVPDREALTLITSEDLPEAQE